MDIFCKIINNEIPSSTIYEDDIVKVILDVNPKSTGHTLIIPKEHCVDLFDIKEETLIYINNISKKISKLLIDKLHCDGIEIVQNNGICEEVKHFHMHLIPVYKSDNTLTKEEVYSLLTNK